MSNTKYPWGPRWGVGGGLRGATVRWGSAGVFGSWGSSPPAGGSVALGAARSSVWGEACRRSDGRVWVGLAASALCLSLWALSVVSETV